MIRKAKASVPSINHMRLQVQENVLSDPGRVMEQMTCEAITRLVRGWRAAGMPSHAKLLP